MDEDINSKTMSSSRYVIWSKYTVGHVHPGAKVYWSLKDEDRKEKEIFNKLVTPVV